MNPIQKAQQDQMAEMVKNQLISLIAPPTPISALGHVQNTLIENRNTLIRAEVDERFLKRQVHTEELGTKNDMEIALGNVQAKIKKLKATIAYLVEIETELTQAQEKTA